MVIMLLQRVTEGVRIVSFIDLIFYVDREHLGIKRLQLGCVWKENWDGRQRIPTVSSSSSVLNLNPQVVKISFNTLSILRKQGSEPVLEGFIWGKMIPYELSISCVFLYMRNQLKQASEIILNENVTKGHLLWKKYIAGRLVRSYIYFSDPGWACEFTIYTNYC